MADIKPFACYRPAVDVAERVAALPYDVYNREEAKTVVQKNPLSFLAIDRAETGLDDSVDVYDDKVYERARALYGQRKEDGTFQKEERECYYIYQLVMDGRSQTGIVACASIEDYEKQIIKKHENTREDKELDRIRHVDSLGAQTGPIFLAYRSRSKINEIVEEEQKKQPLYDFVAEDGITHRVWCIDDKESIKGLKDAFADMKEIYIADGHHRAASAVKVGQMRRKAHGDCAGDEEFLYFLSVLFPDDQLMIMDYNRVVQDLHGESTESFLEKIEKNFTIEKLEAASHPKKKGQVHMYLDKQWYCLTIKDALQKIEDEVDSLDVSLLQDYLLEPVLGIKDPRMDKRIDFVGGIRGLSELERRADTDMKVAFAMYPTSIAELFAVADAGKLMPPKSTWFEPKLRSGLFIHEID